MFHYLFTLSYDQRNRNTDRHWCYFTEYFSSRLQDDSVSDVNSTFINERILPRPDLGEAVPFDQWITVFQRRAEVILDIAQHANWDQFLLLFDEEFEIQARELLFLTSGGSTGRNSLSLRLASLSYWPSLRQNILQYFETSTDFNFVLLTTVSRAEEVLQMVLTLESEIGKRILVTGRSNWLLVSQGGEIHSDLWIFQSRFDNIAILSDPDDIKDVFHEEEEVTHVQVLTTLLYRTGQRELARVGTVDQSWSVHVQSDIFPNIKFGFNGRRFIITTNMWDPYVYRHTKSNGEYEYTGFCIDLAHELARTLNFTIDFTEPPDGGWGADTGNGTWSGMVGQVLRETNSPCILPVNPVSFLHWDVGGLVASESVLRSAGTLLSQVRVPLPAP
ncbi:glutamate receptor ionotropic, kainate 1 [Plakobranchus ocellatus]|uniref:Glutamate receptor ionotropic, kainate 1 n=1 Tax=Plakobranchus ocellatus TaxID=259542 RepID=A0AAV4B5Z9_9GAST|nr:glutamate receptor ionotropic, kainate 1 [Plakobranchus ocellatus]